ncbi:unnamed protein product [Trichobilharzia regenti]|nr:unnamed protein product [Trichobilharzia regenti]
MYKIYEVLKLKSLCPNVPGIRGAPNDLVQSKDDAELRDLLLRPANETDSDTSSFTATIRRRLHTPGPGRLYVFHVFLLIRLFLLLFLTSFKTKAWNIPLAKGRFIPP